MEEVEVPMEGLQEQIHERAHHAAAHSSVDEKWISWVALSSAVLAAFAAVSALLSGHHSNEAMIEQIRASDHWSYFQAKSIKSAILSTRMALQDGKVQESDREKLKKYEEEQAELSRDAKAEESASRAHLQAHQGLARAVTLFQIAIAIGAIAALTKRKYYWWVSLVAGIYGIVFLAQGLFLAFRI